MRRRVGGGRARRPRADRIAHPAAAVDRAVQTVGVDLLIGKSYVGMYVARNCNMTRGKVVLQLCRHRQRH